MKIKAKMGGRYVEWGSIYGNREIHSRVAETAIPNERPSKFRAERQAEIAETSGVYLTGDYERLMPGLSPRERVFACCEFGNTSQFRKDCPVYLSNASKYKVDPQRNKKGGGGCNQNGKKSDRMK